jgi:hypothetical protein
VIVAKNILGWFMRFKLVKTGKTYAEPVDDSSKACREEFDPHQPDVPQAEIKQASCDEVGFVSPILWEAGNVAQIHSLLMVREADLVVAKAQLTGNPVHDWYINNNISELEIMISDLKKWLAEA